MVHYAIISSVRLGKMQRSQGNCFLSPLFQWAGADVPSIERTLALPQRAGAAVALVRSFTAGAHEMSICTIHGKPEVETYHQTRPLHSSMEPAGRGKTTSVAMDNIHYSTCCGLHQLGPSSFSSICSG